MKNIFRYNSLLITLSIGITLHSCNNDPFEGDFETRSLHFSSFGPVNYFLQPYFIDLCDTLLLVADKGHDCYFHLVNTNSDSVCIVYGEKGLAPEAVSFKPVMSHRAFQSKQLVYYDFGRINIRFISLKKLIDGGIPLPDRNYYLPPGLVNAQSVLVVNDDLIVCSGGMSEGKLVFCDPATESISAIDFHPAIKALDNPAENAVIYRSTIASPTDGSIVVSAMLYLKVLEFYTPSGKLINSIKDERSYNNSFNIRDRITSDETQIHYLDVFVSDSLVYALHSGELSGILNDPRLAANTSVQIEVYDLTGNPRYLFNVGRLVTSLAVDEANKVIYALDPYNESQPVIRIHM